MPQLALSQTILRAPKAMRPSCHSRPAKGSLVNCLTGFHECTCLSAPGGFEIRPTRIHSVALAAGDRDRHVHELRLDGRTRANLLQAVDDKPLSRLQARHDAAQPPEAHP